MLFATVLCCATFVLACRATQPTFCLCELVDASIKKTPPKFTFKSISRPTGRIEGVEWFVFLDHAANCLRISPQSELFLDKCQIKVTRHSLFSTKTFKLTMTESECVPVLPFDIFKLKFEAGTKVFAVMPARSSLYRITHECSDGLVEKIDNPLKWLLGRSINSQDLCCVSDGRVSRLRRSRLPRGLTHGTFIFPNGLQNLRENPQKILVALYYHTKEISLEQAIVRIRYFSIGDNDNGDVYYYHDESNYGKFSVDDMYKRPSFSPTNIFPILPITSRNIFFKDEVVNGFYCSAGDANPDVSLESPILSCAFSPFLQAANMLKDDVLSQNRNLVQSIADDMYFQLHIIPTTSAQQIFEVFCEKLQVTPSLPSSIADYLDGYAISKELLSDIRTKTLQGIRPTRYLRDLLHIGFRYEPKSDTIVELRKMVNDPVFCKIYRLVSDKAQLL